MFLYSFPKSWRGPLREGVPSIVRMRTDNDLTLLMDLWILTVGADGIG